MQMLAELGLHAMAEPFRKPSNSWLAAIGFLLFGVLLGGISLAIVPEHMVNSASMRIVNLVITPVVVGLFMVVLGAWRVRRGQPVLRIDRFAYGYGLALSFTLVRYFYAN